MYPIGHPSAALGMREIDRYIADEIFKDEVYKDTLPLDVEEPCILDLGGNIGAAALYYHVTCGAHVFSVEPDRENFEILKLNIDGLPRLHAIRAAVNRRVCPIVLTSPEFDSRPCAYRSHETAYPDRDIVYGLPIEMIISLSGFKHIDLLKVDIEGEEGYLFSPVGDYKLPWLTMVDRIVCEVHEDYMPTTIGKLLAHNGFLTTYDVGTRLIKASR